MKNLIYLLCLFALSPLHAEDFKQEVTFTPSFVAFQDAVGSNFKLDYNHYWCEHATWGLGVSQMSATSAKTAPRSTAIYAQAEHRFGDGLFGIGLRLGWGFQSTRDNTRYIDQRAALLVAPHIDTKWALNERWDLGIELGYDIYAAKKSLYAGDLGATLGVKF